MVYRPLVFAFAFALPLCSPAQDKPAAEREKPRASETDSGPLFTKACLTMQGLDTVSFKSSESHDPAMMRRFKAQMGGLGGGDQTTEVEASLQQGRTHLSFDDGAHEVVLAGSRSIARKGEGAWKLHRGTTANGTPLPYVLDPQQLFEGLHALPAESRKILASSQAKYRDQDVTLLSVEISGKDAKPFARSGLLPRFTGGGSMIVLGGMGMPQPEPAHTSYDVALWIEPATGNVLRMKVRGFQQDPMAGNVRINVNGGDEPEEEEEDEEPKEAKQSDGKTPALDGGLPKRGKRKDVSEFEFDVSFTNHGKATFPELSPEARALLKLGAGR